MRPPEEDAVSWSRDKGNGVSIQMRRSSYAKDLMGLACVATMALCGVRRAVRADPAPPSLALDWPRGRKRTSGA